MRTTTIVRPVIDGWIEEDNGQICLAHRIDEYGGPDRGWVLIDQPYVELSDFRVWPRGEGHGRRILSEALARTDAGGVPTVLDVWETNVVALNLYRSVGFEVTGRYNWPHPGTFEARWALKMRREVSS